MKNARNIAFSIAAMALVVAFSATVARAAEALVIDFNGVLYDINGATGAVSNPRATGVPTLSGIAWSPSGVLYAHDAATNHLFRINRMTGQATQVGFLGVDVVEGDLAFNPVDGLLYGTQTNGGDRLYTINPQTGHATTIGTIVQDGDISAMAFTPNGTLYCLDLENAALYTVDPASGQIITTRQVIGDIVPFSGANTAGMSIDPDSGLLYVVSNLHLDTNQDQILDTNRYYWLTPENGLLRVAGETGLMTDYSGLQFVPEPASLGLVLVGGMIPLIRRRRR